jgi:hypothetical protein
MRFTSSNEKNRSGLHRLDAALHYRNGALDDVPIAVGPFAAAIIE